MTKYYELTCLLNPELTIEEIKKWSEKMNSLIDSFLNDQEKEVKSSVIMEDEEGLKKIKLAYPIKKKNEAFFYVIKFKVPPEKISFLEKELKSDDKILRFRIFSKKPEIPLVKKAKILIKKPVKRLSLIKKDVSKKVEIEEIDKKLKEVLGE